MNLVGNAAQFTETGGISVRVEMQSRPSDTIKLQFAVTDTGIGIAPDNQRAGLSSGMTGAI